MTNLAESQGEIKATLEHCTGTPTSKLIAILEAAGITNTAEIARLAGIKIRAVQAARRRALECVSAPQCAHHNAPAHQDALENAPQCAKTHHNAPRARVDNNTSLPNLEDSLVINNNPLPPSKTELGKPKRKLAKPKLEFGLAEAREAFVAYNEAALRCAIPQAAKLTPDRERKIIARLKDYGMAGWNQALANIEKSAFLTGENDRGWRVNLEFLLQPASFAKLHDGGYGNGRHAKPTGSRMMEILNRKSLEAAI